MSPPDGSTTLTLKDSQAEEDRMRAALGLTPQSAQPSRSGQPGFMPMRDSAGPVTVVTRRPIETDGARARLAELADVLKAERGERVAAQQALADERLTIQQLQAKLAHTEMGAAEALDAERKARLAAEARVLEVPLLTVAKSAAEQDGPRKPGRPRKAQPVSERAAEPRKPGRPPGKRTLVEMPEQEPVQWWLPSYAAEAKRRRSKA